MKSTWRPLLVAIVLFGAVALVAVACGKSGDDDDNNADDAGGGPPLIPHGYDNTTNCLAPSCHAGVHGGSFDNAQIPTKCLTCHSPS